MQHVKLEFYQVNYFFFRFKKTPPFTSNTAAVDPKQNSKPPHVEIWSTVDQWSFSQF